MVPLQPASRASRARQSLRIATPRFETTVIKQERRGGVNGRLRYSYQRGERPTVNITPASAVNMVSERRTSKTSGGVLVTS